MGRNWRGMFAMEGGWPVVGAWRLDPEIGLGLRILGRVSPGIRFLGYTPGCFFKSGEVVENVGVVWGAKSRVWKVLYLKEFGTGVIRT